MKSKNNEKMITNGVALIETARSLAATMEETGNMRVDGSGPSDISAEEATLAADGLERLLGAALCRHGRPVAFPEHQGKAIKKFLDGCGIHLEIGELH